MTYITSKQQLKELLYGGDPLGITGIVLPNCNFKSVPEIVYECHHLLELDLSHNRIKTISRKIGNLKQLQLLNLSYNKISDLPLEICLLTRLDMLGMVTQEDESDKKLAPMISIANNQGIATYFFYKKYTELKAILADFDSSEHGIIKRLWSQSRNNPFQIETPLIPKRPTPLQLWQSSKSHIPLEDWTPFKVHSIWLQQTHRTISGMVMEKHNSPHHYLVMLYRYYGFFHNHISKLIRKIDGNSYYIEKAHTVLEGIYRYYAYGTIIDWAYTEQQAYKYPCNLLVEHKDIINYFESLNGLLLGYFEAYFEEVSVIEEKAIIYAEK